LMSTHSSPSRPTTSTLSLHDALPILLVTQPSGQANSWLLGVEVRQAIRTHSPTSIQGGVTTLSPIHGHKPHSSMPLRGATLIPSDRKSTRLNSSHEWISYAVFCLQK